MYKDSFPILDHELSQRNAGIRDTWKIMCLDSQEASTLDPKPIGEGQVTLGL
jgi:hypothetical protein